jgi:ATP-dependent RNA helicase TDRD9
MIAQDCIDNGEDFNILVSQPRKIAAITNSQRVADETGCELGTSVGFQVGLLKELSNTSDTTKIAYCTTGVILQKLIRSLSMKQYSHIVLGKSGINSMES